MARPVKEPHERRTAQLPPVRVTEAELIDVQAQAKAASRDLTSFIRERALTGRTVAAAPSASHSLLVELSRAGNNLNQIARHMNRGRGVPDDLALSTGTEVSAIVGFQNSLAGGFGADR